ncbi:MAG: LamG-like jellyroll fold domain-containing protein [Caldilineaceae bacterium]
MGRPANVRMVWVVQVLNDICAAYEDNICSEYSALNVPQVMQTYADEWYLSGLHVTEEHGADMALIYADPQAFAPAGVENDQPLYLETLYGLLYGLDSTFLAGADCDSVDGNGACVGNDQRDITVAEIARRFEHTTNGGVSATARWNLPNVLRVDRQTYASSDIGLLTTAVTETVRILEETYTPAWSASQPITPTIMLAYEDTARSVNLDAGLAGNANLAWSNQTLTLNFRQSGADAVNLNTMAVVKWAPYAYTATGGWAGADINQFYDNALASQLARDFDGAFATPEENETYQTLAQVLYLAAYQGNLRLVEIGALVNGQIQRQLIAQKYQQASESIAALFLTQTLKFIPTAMKGFITFSETWAEIANGLTKAGEQATASAVISKFLSTKVFAVLKTVYGIAGLIAGIAVVALLATAAIAKYILHSSQTVWGDILKYGIGSLSILIAVVGIGQAVYTIYEMTTALTFLLNVSLSRALILTLSVSSELTGSIRVLQLIGLIISIGIAIGFYIYAYASGQVQPGTIAASQLFATTLATIIVSVLLFALSVTVVGALVVTLVALVDTILTLVGVQWSITGSLIKYISYAWYYFDMRQDIDVDTGQLGMQIADPNLGIMASNRLTHTLPITTVLTSSGNPNLQRNTVRYRLSQEAERVGAVTNSRKNEWILSGSKGQWRAEINDLASYSELPPVGINSIVPLWLNTGYTLDSLQCWLLLCRTIPVYGQSSVDLGDAVVLDVLPNTLDAFMDFGSWAQGGALQSVRAIDRDGDGLIAAQYGGVDLDDTTWDTDHDNLSDAYELTMRSRANIANVGALSPTAADTDGDGVNDDVEIRNATNPAQRDTDGDGIQDALEIPFFVNADGAPNFGGWTLPYAYNPANGAVAETRAWSDPLQADADGDGLSDLYERTRVTCPTCTPWADPDSPEVYNPNVWNLSPVALYVEDDTVDGFVAPGESVVYTTTTANNLGSGQELVGELSLSVPNGVNGGPLAALVNIANGERASLVSNLSFGGQNSAAYDFTSHTQLTNLFETRWAWEQSSSTSSAILGETLLSVAVSPLTGWNGSHLVVTRERKSPGDAIVAYVVESDGTIIASRQLGIGTATAITDPDVACNMEGICLAVWGLRVSGSNSLGYVMVQKFKNSLTASPSSSSIYLGSVAAIYNAVVTSNGTDFMATWTLLQTNSSTRVQYAPISASSGAGSTKLLAALSGKQAAAVAWNGTNYTLAWTGESTLSWRSVAQDGALADAKVYTVAGDGWPRADGSKRPPTLAHDEISDQTLLAYRSSAGGLVARMVDNDTSAPFTLANAGLDGADVTVALAADGQNGGWVAAWTPVGGGRAEYRAIAPSGALRGAIHGSDQNALTTVALACIQPRMLLELPFDEDAGATLFADASGNGNDAVCDGACPVSGIDGFSGRGVAFNGVDQALRVDGVHLAGSSFTMAAWARLDSLNQASTMMTFGDYADAQAGRAVRLAAFSDQVQCQLFNVGAVRTAAAPAAGAWHHWACIYDQQSRALTLYQDGAAVDSITVNSGYTGNDTLRIGRQYNPGAPNAGFFFNGAIDSVMAVDRALSADEVAKLAQGALAAYALDEPPGSEIFVNAIGSGLNGRCESAATCSCGGRAGFSLHRCYVRWSG